MGKYHTIHYFDLYNQTQQETTSQILQKCFDKGQTEYVFYIEGKKYIFNILEIDESHIFGQLSRYDDYKESLTMIKARKDEKPLNPEEYIFEKITFFYIKIDDNVNNPSRLSAITNISLNIEKCFSSYFSEKYGMLPIIIFNTLVPDIKSRIEKLKSISTIEGTFSDISTTNNQTKFNSIFDFGCFLKNVSFKIKFKEKLPKNIKSIIDNANKNFTRLKINGRTEIGPEPIDVLNHIFIKQSKIETENISYKNFEPIKKALNNFSDL